MASTSRIVGGMATPTAWKILPQIPFFQPFNDRQKSCHIGRISGPHLTADRLALIIDNCSNDHLNPVGQVVFAEAELANTLSTAPLKFEVKLKPEVLISGTYQLFAVYFLGQLSNFSLTTRTIFTGSWSGKWKHLPEASFKIVKQALQVCERTSFPAEFQQDFSSGRGT